MKVGIVGITENDYIRGVERYTLELTRYLARLYPNSIFYLLRGAWQTYYNELSKFENVRIITIKNLKNSKLRRHFFIAFKLFDFLKEVNIKLDVIHYNNTLPIVKKTSIPSVITIHDIAEFFVPEKYSTIQRLYRKQIIRISAKNANKIITDSKFSAYSIIAKLSVSNEKVIPIYLGIEHFYEKLDLDFLNEKPEKNDYILYWSVIEHSKGVIETIKTFNLINKEYPKLKLIVIGKKGNAYKDFLKLIKSNNNIKYLDYVNDKGLMKYIKHARLILFPSKYEGFGFPPLEAFVLNDNIITSNTTSLGEISSEFAIQVNPTDIQELYKAIKRLLEYPLTFEEEEKKEILRKFSWKNTARKTFEVYNSLLGGNE